MQPLSTPSRTAPTLSRRQWLATTLTLLGAGTVASIASAFVAILVFQLRSVPISGPGSLGQYAAIAGAVVAFVAFVAVFNLKSGCHGIHLPGALFL